MGKKKGGFLPVFTAAEMVFQREPSIPEVREFQIPTSWAPITPEKPNLPKPQPICADTQENQLGHENWFPPERFPQETQFHGLETCCESSSSIDTNKGANLENWEAALAWKSDFSMDSFKSLMALADAAAMNPCANSTGEGNSNPFISTFSSQFEGDRFESNPGAASPPPANQGISFGLNSWSSSSCAPETPLYGDSIPSRCTYDLNSPPRRSTEAFSSWNISFQYAPITPDQSKKAENKLACNVHNSSGEEIAKEVATTRVEENELHHDKEQQQPTKDFSSAAVSTELQENHNPDKGISNTGIDLNKTPQQKPRRKKHRPKVVIEGQKKRTPKAVTPKNAGPKESSTPKRKYVRRKGLNKSPVTPPAEVISGCTDPKTIEKSCRRALNFDFENQVREESSSCRPESNDNAESQAQNFSTRVEPKSTVQLGQGMDVIVEKSQAGIAYDLTRSMSKVVEDYLSLPELQGLIPPTPPKTYPSHDKVEDDAQQECARGKCRIVFSNETHDKQGNITQMKMNTDLPSAQRSPNDSNCSSSTACLTEEGQARGLKRGHSCTIDEAEPSRINVVGGHTASSDGYVAMFPATYNNHGIPGMLFPAIYKKKRTEKGHGSTTSSALFTHETNCRFSAAQFNNSSTSTKNTSFIDARDKKQAFECKLALNQKGRMTKKRSKGPTRVRDFASLIGIVGCNQFPTFPAQGAPISGDMQMYETSHNPYTCMEALVAGTHTTMTTKKRTKRNSFASSVTADARQKRIPTVDVIAEYLDSLDINLESVQVAYQEQGPLVPYNYRYREQRVLVPHNFRYEAQNALVLYQRDGTVVPFEGEFNPVRKRKPRPKVDLDEETTRVWKLLLESINSEGIDGTDEEKAKWWENERRVFRGRTDSFIARMHLVQGDRRFSPWKGSVVDSVIGVFLTQNVSDHLSSSAFMSLAARFPLKSETNDTPCSEEISIRGTEPEVCILDPDDTIKWHEESNQLARNGSSMTHHEMDCNVEKGTINLNELLECSSGGVRSTDILKCESSDISGNGLEIYKKSTANGAVIQLTGLTGAVESFVADKRELDDVLSSQNSTGSPQNSVDSAMAQTAQRIGSLLQDNSEADPETRSKPNSLVGSSFVELLQRETLRGLHNPKPGNASSYKENGCTYIEGSEYDAQNKDRSDNPATSLRHIISSSNYHLQMTSESGVLEAESFEMLREESQVSDISMKNDENSVSEQSGVTAESVHQGTVQNLMSASCQEAPKSPSENNHACSSLQGDLNKVFRSQNRSVGNPKDGIQSQTQEQNRRMQVVLETPSLLTETLDVTDSTSIVNNPKSTEHNAVESNLKDPEYLPEKEINEMSSRVKRGRVGKQKQNPIEWDSLRLQAQAKGKRETTANTMDSLDYEAVRCADVSEIAHTIRERGMNNMLAERIKDFLNRLVREHGSIDLEWLRDVPPDKAKEYLLSVRGLGLKSVECVRLLTLHHLAFPVDTNVGRIAVRLGWVPLQPLPESLQLHLLELYPVLESIQRYLWPRLCKLDQRTLYELHYQMITFGKVFCTKSKPNCNACPMRGECRHFASAFASARLALPGPEEKSIVSAPENIGANQYPMEGIKPSQLPLLQANEQLQMQSHIKNCEPIVEEPATPEPTVEMPATPEPEQPQDIEDAFWEDPEEIPTIKLNIEELTHNLQNYMQRNMELQEGEMSKALVALTPEAASLPMPKLKNVNRLRTEHRVYELPDSHPLLEGLDKREPDDPCSYLLAIWTPGETPDSIQPPERSCSSQEFGNLCDEKTCFSCNSIREANSQTVRGTILIPCRTAMRGSFPLNGTYFQVNEVFADHESSINPIDVQRTWLWNLPRRTVYFGTSIPTIFKGLTTEGIQYCFWKGFVCVRGFDQKTRAPRPLMARLHFPASKLTRTKGKTDDKQE